MASSTPWDRAPCSGDRLRLTPLRTQPDTGASCGLPLVTSTRPSLLCPPAFIYGLIPMGQHWNVTWAIFPVTQKNRAVTHPVTEPAEKATVWLFSSLDPEDGGHCGNATRYLGRSVLRSSEFWQVFSSSGHP